MKNTLMTVLCGAAILTSGCSILHKSDLATLQGTWQGRVISEKAESPCSFVMSGSGFEFRDASADIWYKGTFSLREDTTPKQYIAVISACPISRYVGKTCRAIYRIEDGTLTLTGYEPGNPSVPSAFDAPDAARLELKRK
jgi:uncharacterized protein (TIGR03067 family)